MGQIQYTAGLLMILVFTVAIISYATNFGTDNDAAQQLSTDLQTDTEGSQLKSDIRTYKSSADTSIAVFQNSTISSGDETTRTYQNIVDKLQRIKATTTMRRIYIFDKNFRSLADTESQFQIGREYSHLRFDQQEISNVFQGQTASSILFTGIDGRLYKSGYAPIFLDHEVLAAVRVEGSAQTLESIKEPPGNLCYPSSTDSRLRRCPLQRYQGNQRRPYHQRNRNARG